ncbi:uncharacterized protein LOC119687915 [Teleopsis dalmanni]|uniref:uncharacterized protein LOC119687915 n=1 Tax=Teleopsis dalmanni TaxID=139649 RepID=UPI0018CFC0BE|nr:uncharacterized protein LOC119687915 [Teleopsis dalmanni]
MTTELKQQRANTKKNISRIRSIIERNAKSDTTVLSPIELKCCLGILESYFTQLMSYQTRIEELEPEDNMREQLGEDLHMSLRDHTFSPVSSNTRLSPLKLPSFSGTYSEYKNFISSFNQIIDREVGLSNIEKFNHLLNCLHGQSLDTVQVFQVSNENYPNALQRLKSCYDNSSLIFMENIASLFELPHTSRQSCSQLRSLVDNVSAIYNSLRSIGSDKQISNAMLIYLVMQKVDDSLKNKWKKSLDFNSLPLWEDCAKVLERRCQFLASIETPLRSQDIIRRNDNKFSKKIDKHQSRQNCSFVCTKRTCPLRDSTDHIITACQRFNNMSVPDRFRNVKRLSLCISCLFKNYKVTQCTSTFKCKICSRSHHTMLHRAQNTSSTFLVSPAPQPTVQTTSLLFILLLPRERHNIQISSIGDTNTRIKHKTSTNIKSRFADFEIPLDFCITSHISYQPQSQIDITSWNLPANTKLADENFYKSNRIDLLLGTETFFNILSVGQIKLRDNLPTLQKTLLGWVASGKYNSDTPFSTKSSACLLSCEEAINFNLEQLWKLDEISSTPELTDEKSNCEAEFCNTLSRNAIGSVVVRLPFKDTLSSLGPSRDIAFRRLTVLERRLSRMPEIKAQYVAFMICYVGLGGNKILIPQVIIVK